jgi:hypothetical protein
VKSWGKLLLWALLGTLLAVAGVMAFQNPPLAAKVLTLTLGVALIVSGILRILLAMQINRGHALGLGRPVGRHHRARGLHDQVRSRTCPKMTEQRPKVSSTPAA